MDLPLGCVVQDGGQLKHVKSEADRQCTDLTAIASAATLTPSPTIPEFHLFGSGPDE